MTQCCIKKELLCQLFVLGFSLYSTGCNLDSANSLNLIPPIITFSCSTGQENDCSNTGDGANAYIGWLKDLDINCSSYLLSLALPPLHPHFYLLGNTTAIFENGLLTGTVEEWVDEYGLSVNSVPNSSYKLCGFIDIDSDQVYDASEPMTEETISLDSTPSELVQWF